MMQEVTVKIQMEVDYDLEDSAVQADIERVIQGYKPLATELDNRCWLGVWVVEVPGGPVSGREPW